MFNTVCGVFEVKANEIAAMMFSGFLPAQGIGYDDHHSMVVESAGVYEIHYALRAISEESRPLSLAITNDGKMIPCSQASALVEGHFALSGMALTQAHAGAHLHFIVFAKCDASFALQEGVSLMFYAKKLAGLPRQGQQPPAQRSAQQDEKAKH
jgi:hypothetical protein